MIVVITGHSPAEQGAVSVTGTTEYEWNTALAVSLVRALRLRFEVIHMERPPGPYSRAVQALARQVNALHAALVIELHFDASTNPNARGSSCLHWPRSEVSAGYAAAISSACAGAIGTRNRGAIAQARSWAGAELWILSRTLCPSVIVESHFGSNADDHDAATEARDSGVLAEAIAEAISHYGLLRAAP